MAGAHSLVRVAGGELSYLSSDATSLNTLTARIAGDYVELRDPTVDGGIDPGPCRPGDVSDDVNAWIVEVSCRRATVARVRVDLADREDSATLELPLPVQVAGGSGADTIRTGAGPDRIDGGDGNDRLAGEDGGDELDGGPGRDRIDAGSGEDVVRVRDGLHDVVVCGTGRDSVDADTLDEVAADCESVTRTPTPPPADGGEDDRTPPDVDAGAGTRQRVGSHWKVRIAATSSEPGWIAASGFLDAAGLSLPLRSDRRRVSVGGGAADLTVVLRGRQRREARRALRRGRKVTVRMGVVATDLAGISAQVRAPRIRLVSGPRARAATRALAASARCSARSAPPRPGEIATSHDQDCDGVDDNVDNCPPRVNHDRGTYNPDQRDSDGDGLGDRCDGDDDDDGIADADDNCRTVKNPDQAPSPAAGVGAACYVDGDVDGIVDERDNCPATANADQSDGDGDGTGDACDPDPDGDFVRDDGADNCPGLANPGQEDADRDGVGDACDSSPTGASGPGAPSVPGAAVDREPPALTVRPRSSVPVTDLAGRLPTSVSCNESCALVARLSVGRRTARRARLGRHGLTIARGAGALAARGRTYVFLRPRPGIVRRLRRAGRVPATLQIVATDAAGNERTVKRPLVVRR